ncbi:agmatine deiminase [Pectobacterium parmentieri]|uniref:Putative agmatine deiminase n=1 Tax=Pectobacterium parmentieri TaxID=1905730 RepID=A0A8B3FH87_PECPM|nr:agmatine deiminase [Pectobacterium parmentieri]AOR60682.1 agmatine deiminase [Pectobacterium parmentieri]AYH08383.1 agmatine deiminase [Pectobacterium parmentieri]AYH17126.1 agmatine deiminase [Pectobacterium parmentieri]AYH34740.1 agmatine deiminase [Pectobacterium parmentieri]AZS54815.1 agmatine deiminase [Pectobacterium parmentieri]
MSQLATPYLTTPHQDGFAMPAEWAPHDAVWMIWPYRTDNWREQGAPAQKTFARVAEAIAQNTPVIMGVPASYMADAQKVMPVNVTLVEMESDDAWMRDTGPTIVLNQAGERRGIDWQFNAWGGELGGLYEDWRQDENVAAQVLDYHQAARYTAPLILEGGSIHVDGEGTLLTTAECLLNPNRNPHLSKAEIEQLMRDYLSISTIIWLEEGVYNDETDGHIDNMCCFVRPGEVALHWTDDENDPQYARSVAAYEVLSAARDAQGRELKIWKLPAPGPLHATIEEAQGVDSGDAIERLAGSRLAGSYVNFLISNQQIVFPLLDEKTDDIARDLLQQMFPGYLISGVPAREILLGGGNIHCITQQIPAVK